MPPQAGADTNVENKAHETPCYLASLSKVEDSGETLRLLLGAGADVNVRGGLYGYPLAAASGVGHVEKVQMLLEAGAS